MYRTLDSSGVIVCEGFVDRTFLELLIEHRGLPPFQVIQPSEDKGQPGGKENLWRPLIALPALKNFEYVEVVVVFVDNDDANAFGDAVGQIELAQPGYATPTAAYQPESAPPMPTTAVYLMPRGAFGNLDTVLLEEIYECTPSLRACMADLVECAAINGWTEGKRAKALLQAAIAVLSRDKPDKSLDSFLRSGACPLRWNDNAVFADIATFLSQFGTVRRLDV